MDLTHVHLLLNHFPTIGFVVGLFLFVVGLFGKSDDLKRVSLVIFLGIALLSIPTYVTGNAAGQAICVARPEAPCTDARISKAAIEAHESAALLGLAFMEFTGAFAWLGLWQFRRNARISRTTLATVLLLSLVTFGVMANASNLGGQIRHPEVQSTQPAGAANTQKSLARQIGSLVGGGLPWAWPTFETLHFIGLCLLFGVAALLDLRVLGMMKSVPFPALHRLLPWGILGFGVNLVTGILFFVANPEQYTENVAFHWKIVLIVLAGINVIYFTIFDAPWALQPGDDAPLTAKVAAATALFLVFGVMYFGRMLPFLGNAF